VTDRGWSAAAALPDLAAAIARDGWEQIARADQAAIAALPARRNPRGVAIARAVSAIAEPGFAGPVVAAAMVVDAGRRGWRAAGLTALAVPAGVLGRWLLSELIARPRPPAEVWLAEPEGYSSPSRHTTLAALTAGVVAGASGAHGVPKHAIPIAAAASVGASRVYLGVHWPTDVVAGWIFAAAWLALVEALARDPAPARQSPRAAGGRQRAWGHGPCASRPRRAGTGSGTAVRGDWCSG
jgi:membrane-associated phospholipid phosphatase